MAVLYYSFLCMLSISTRNVAIMLQKLSITLLNRAPKITHYAFKKMPIIPKPLFLASNQVYSYIGQMNYILFQLQI